MDYIRAEGDAQILEKSVARVKAMYYHTMMDGQQRVIISADWYMCSGTSRTGLCRVRYNPNWKGCSVAFLDQCDPLNLVLWPVDLSKIGPDTDMAEYMTDPDNEFEVIYK